MALKSVLTPEEHEALADNLKTEYKADAAGNFYLDITEFGKHPGAVTLKTSLNGVNTKLTAATAENTALKTKFGPLVEDENFSIEEFERLKAGNKDTPEAIQKIQEAHKTAIAALNTKHAADLAAKDADNSKLNGYIERTVVDTGLKDALFDVGVNPDLMDGAVATLRGRVKVAVGDDDQRAAVVTTDIGDVPVADFVKEWAGSDKGKPYLGKASGPPADGNTNRGRNAPKGNMGGTPQERAAALKSKFPELG